MSNPALEKNVKWARAAILGKFPYFAPMLLRIPYQILEGKGETAFVTKDGRMGLGDGACKDRNLLAGAILHELQHVIFKHFDRIGQRDPTAWNLATDAVINETLLRLTQGSADVKMGSNWIYASTLGQSWGNKIPNAEQVYAQLMSDGKKVSLPNKCGSGAGNPNEEEASLTIEPGLVDEVATAVAVRQVVAGLVEAAKRAGVGSSEIDMWANALVAPPKVDYRQLIRSLVTRDIASATARRSESSWKRLNRRGYDLPGRIRYQPVWAAGVDTSGSMCSEGGKVLGEIAGLLTQLGPGRVVTGDTQVKNDKTVRTIAEFREVCRGGGGTDMTPLIQAMEKEPVVIIITDAYVPLPACKHDHVLWIVTSGHKEDWMKRVVMVDKE